MTQSNQNDIYVYGKHAVTEALKNAPKTLKKVFVEDGPVDNDLLALVRKSSVPISYFAPGKLPKEVVVYNDSKIVHQGVIGIVAADVLIKPFKEFLSKLQVTPDTCLVLLGEIQDPQNVGAVIRSAAAFGVKGVLIPEHNQAQISGTVVKVSAGMAFRVPLVTVGNVQVAIKDLKDKGFWIYGLDGSAEKSLSTETFDAPTVFILGNEATGIREKTLEHCDIPLSIPMAKECESLNAAASASVALYAWSSQHKGSLGLK
ncbi:MAG: hypothetical protein RL094_701 [Candidatus Parcubacteria bacterium]|jgi:23S rRNA (guanosine2251-2'-O)-methyltransferase